MRESGVEGNATLISSEFGVDDASPAGPSDDELDDLDYEPFHSGDVIGRYRIDSLLGRGATGLVYEATHLVVGRRVAVKCLFPHLAREPVKVQRLFREAKIAARVEHPNVVQVFDGGRDRDTYYLAMEFLEGQTLADLLAVGPLSVEAIVAIFLQVMSGVAAVHEEGVVHRDLKPENIFMQTRPLDPFDPGIPKVLDFGVSKLYELGDDAKLTAAGIVMGTPFYMAPEQVTDTSSVDHRADVYSLGVMLYEAITGSVPYAGGSVVEIFTRAHDGRPRPIREVRPEVPPSLEALVARALCPDKEARFDSVDEMREALVRIPLDGSDEPDDWSDVSQPWMLDKANADLRELGLEDQPTEVQAPASLTPLTNPRPAEMSTSDRTSDRADVPLFVWLLVAAACGSLVAALGAAALYFVLA